MPSPRSVTDIVYLNPYRHVTGRTRARVRDAMRRRNITGRSNARKRNMSIRAKLEKFWSRYKTAGGVRRAVYYGRNKDTGLKKNELRTRGGLKAEDLDLNKRGKVVSKRVQAAAKKAKHFRKFIKQAKKTKGGKFKKVKKM